MEVIEELVNTCAVVVSEEEISYAPHDAPSIQDIHHRLQISQFGAYVFHRALLRPGKPQTKGDV